MVVVRVTGEEAGAIARDATGVRGLSLHDRRLEEAHK